MGKTAGTVIRFEAVAPNCTSSGPNFTATRTVFKKNLVSLKNVLHKAEKKLVTLNVYSWVYVLLCDKWEQAKPSATNSIVVLRKNICAII